MKKKRKKPLLPIDIPLSESVLEGGAVFVTLRTLDELEDFWNKHRETLPFAVQGIFLRGDKRQYLNPYEWIFAPTKYAVVKAVFRWDQMGIRCEWYDWANESPGDHASWFMGRDQHRERQIAKGEWSIDDEADYQADCKVRSPDTYRGWWRLDNLPCGINHLDWFSPFADEINDSGLSIEAAARRLQEQTFDDWKRDYYENEIEFEDTESLNDEIAYWREEQRRGCEYYGQEDEDSLLPDDAEDQRIDAIAAERVATFDPAKAIPMEEMFRRFGIKENGKT